MALEIHITDSTDYSRDVLFFSIQCTQMDEQTFLTMSEMLQDEFEWPIRYDRTDIKVKEVFEKLQHMFPDRVKNHTADHYLANAAYYIIRDMIVPSLIFTRVVNRKIVRVRPYAEGAERLHELFP